MSKASVIDQLDKGIEALLFRSNGEVPVSDPEVAELLALATELRALPRPDFKAELKADLVGETISIANMSDISGKLVTATPAERGRKANAPILPTIAGSGYGLYPVQRSSFMASLVAHAAMLALLVTSGIWAAPSFHEKPSVHSVLVTDLSSYVLPPAPDRTGGGGGGGDSDILQESNGNPPRFAREQITPPAIIVRSEQPKLPAEPTVVGPPALSFPQSSSAGDPFARVLAPLSNGTGTGGGIGNGDRGGVGPGLGPGVGDGSRGGIGGGPYLPGGGVSAPHLIYDPEPEYSEEARKQKYQGVVVLQVVVGDDGRPRDVRIVRSVGLGLDEKALEAVRQWRFAPGMLDGRPVAVLVNIQVNFRLY
jgi:periplasmic protein TonB